MSRRFGIALDWAADHVGDALFLFFAVAALAGVAVAVVALVASAV